MFEIHLGLEHKLSITQYNMETEKVIEPLFVKDSSDFVKMPYFQHNFLKSTFMWPQRNLIVISIYCLPIQLLCILVALNVLRVYVVN